MSSYRNTQDVSSWDAFDQPEDEELDRSEVSPCVTSETEFSTNSRPETISYSALMRPHLCRPQEVMAKNQLSIRLWMLFSRFRDQRSLRVRWIVLEWSFGTLMCVFTAVLS